MPLRSKYTIEDMKTIAKERGGKCLSKKYVNPHTKLEWKCKIGHMWAATPNNVKKGTWCPKCARKKIAESQKLTVEEMQKIAHERSGKCLSGKYVNSDTKLKWQCSEGHIWEAVPDSIRRGSWCPQCAKINRNKLCGIIQKKILNSIS